MNSNVDKMRSFIVMDVLERAKELESEGADVIHLEVGEPDFNMPQAAVEAVARAAADGNTHYTHSLGLLQLRQAIANQYNTEYGVKVSADNIVVTCGSSQAILMALLLLCNTGDEVIISNPGYACYRNFILAANAVPVEVPLSAENDFQFDIQTLKKVITPRTRAIIVNSPMNPTGTLMHSDVMQQMAQLGITVISDEIYHGLVYEGKAETMLQHTDNTLIINGFSKRYAMTGLRLGYLIAPEQFMRKLQIIQQNLFICAPSVSQYGALAALTSEQAETELVKMRQTYDERRKYLISRLREIGFTIHTEPKGAFYIFADARCYASDTYRFAFDALEQAHVGITPGIDFGSRGEGFVRFSYANSIENIGRAMNRLETWIKENF
ncbi:MAG: pyridoxal phosphate-dependent aminotransferase [Bacteroidales bacterium]|nr:pyridoxal phosphate-dependent aminotransferase [Bacteroidales bacterium]